MRSALCLLALLLLATPAAAARPDAELVVLDLQTGGSQQLTRNDVEDLEPAWSRDGRRIAFMRCCKGQRFQIFYGGVGSSRVRVVPRSTGGCQPAWSPDGTRLAYARRMIRVVDLDGVLLTSFVGTDPAWTPDGRIVYAIPNGGLWLKNGDGTGQRSLPIPIGIFSAFGPDWSRDGRIVFSAIADQVDDAESLWTVREDGSGVRRLTPAVEGRSDSQPV
jgi:TolB protein